MSEVEDALIAYDADLHAWTAGQARLLRAGRLAELDVAHIAEELEDLGSSKRSELESRLAVLLLHLLEWEYQPVRRGASWERTIREQRRALHRLRRRTPSLHRIEAETLADAYKDAMLRAVSETGLPEGIFASGCPYALEDVLDEDFWPEPSR